MKNNQSFFSSFVSATAAVLVFTTPALAQHAADILVGSDADGSGALIVDYPFDEVSVIPVTASGFPGVFTANDPGFVPAEDDALEGVFELDIPTTVGLELMAIDDNVQVQMGVTTLSESGDAAVIGTHDNADPELSGLHQHAQFLLSLTSATTGDFAEGTFWFRIYDDGAGYAASAVHKLELSNGYLPPLEAAPSSSPACRRAISKSVRKIGADSYKRVAACFDSALEAVADSNPLDAAGACNLDPSIKNSLAQRLDTAHAKGMESAAKSCGALSDSSVPFTESSVSAHLAMASCRAQELAGATYGEARAALEEVLAAAGGDGACPSGTCVSGVLAGSACSLDDDCSVEQAIDTTLPCLKTAAGHE